ncbi:MAG: TIGR01212 family radical SAM protein [Bacteroidota bacterium]
MDYYWGHSRRFNAYAEFFKREFGSRVQKLTLDAGFSCPNRDGSLGVGGCTYCNNDAFNPSYCTPSKSITQQLEEGVAFHLKRYRRATNFLAYFQAYSNTYESLAILKGRYEEALAFPGVIGLVIGTRPDCVPDEVLDYLASLNRRTFLLVEYGVESIKEETLLSINRGHTYSKSVESIKKTAALGIRTAAHFILGLPGESRDEMIGMATEISGLPLHSIKLHQLQIVHGTKMALEYAQTPEKFEFFSLDNYIELIVDFLERLNPSFVVERFAGEVPPRFLVGPGWGKIRNDQILVRVEKRLEERQTYQGRLFT